MCALWLLLSTIKACYSFLKPILYGPPAQTDRVYISAHRMLCLLAEYFEMLKKKVGILARILPNRLMTIKYFKAWYHLQWFLYQKNLVCAGGGNWTTGSPLEEGRKKTFLISRAAFWSKSLSPRWYVITYWEGVFNLCIGKKIQGGKLTL